MTFEHLKDRVRLVVQGPDRPGLVKQMGELINRNKGNIISLDQYSDDPAGGNFFQRVVFYRADFHGARPEIEADLARTLEPLGLTWRLADASLGKPMIVLVSRSDHCLLDLLWRYHRGNLPVAIPLVISNHTNLAESVRSFGIPFLHVPSQGADKSEAESRILDSVVGNCEFLVLARYMQILSADFLGRVGMPVINIHHSFLPAFAGADPYRQAKDRGVKLVGATAHYVTPDLDEGPIIEQDTARVTHAMTVHEMRARGADIERTVLSRAVKWHAEDRVALDGHQTVVFN